MILALFLFGWLPSSAQAAVSAQRAPKTSDTPPHVVQARRFLARRGFSPGQRPTALHANAAPARPQSSPASAPWQPLGPGAVASANYGLVTGRVSSLALDPADSKGNRLYVGTTGGGIWKSSNAGNADVADVVFTPLTDTILSSITDVNGNPITVVDPSISIGALTVQPGGTGVILAGTGDPNDALDSYYGAGILRSPDNGVTWDLIQTTADQKWGFIGEGFAGFAWSTSNPQLVVAAVSQAWEGTLVDAGWSNLSYEGIYYSTDAGLTWSLAQITDQNGLDVQGPLDVFTSPDGNAATSIVWNSFRGVFIAAVRFHGYYQSADGIHWTQLAEQPSSSLRTPSQLTKLCPTNPASTGSPACPIYRGTLAVNPATGDTFAWTVDENNQDQGIWQDVCAASGSVCTTTISFPNQVSTTKLETDTFQGAATIANGDYNLALAAIPSGQDTILLTGGNDVWKCSLAASCAWRNTTNATTCMSGQVGAYQHALAWNISNPLELFIGNDSGLWRSLDDIAQSDPACASSDAGHFQNLNGSLGSLAEVESMSSIGVSPYTMMLGLGANGTAGVTSTTGPTTQWPQILGGEGGPVAIDPSNAANWYVNNGAGVSIHLCTKAGACAPADFGAAPAVSDADVNGDGLTMTSPAPFLVDPVDPTQLLVATCRIWRGPANGTGWTLSNAISPMFDGNRANAYCSGNALVRSIAAMALPGGGEVVYAGTYGSANGSASLPGHILSASMNAAGVWSSWQDLTSNPVGNDQIAFNSYGLDISSLFIDSHDPTGKTVYVTVAGMSNLLQTIRVAYRSVDGGTTWSVLQSNLPSSPANGLVVDPNNAKYVYLATDMGVYFTQNVAACATTTPSNCWSAYGSGLPTAPVVALSAAPAATAPDVLAAATYGRGVWQIPLATAGTQLTTATLDPTDVEFGTQAEGSASSVLQTVTLTNNSPIALAPTSVAIGGAHIQDFIVITDGCTGQQVSYNEDCTVALAFSPTDVGDRKATLTINANVPSGSVSADLHGTGAAAGKITLNPTVLNFDLVLGAKTPVGTTSTAVPVTVNNSGGVAVQLSSVTTLAPFAVANSCGSSIAGGTSCQLMVSFAPTKSGAASANLTVVDDTGTQTAVLTGTGAAPPTDTLSTTSLTFPNTVIGQNSPAQTITLTNSGDLPLTSIKASVTAGFQISANTCTSQLAPNSTHDAACTFSVVFSPTQPGPSTGTLTISDILNAGQLVNLSGSGLLPPPTFTIQIVPSQVNFPTTGVNTTSTPVTLTVMNSTTGPALSDLSLSVSAGFNLVNNQCGSALAASASCTTGVSFAPTALGPQMGTFTVSSTALAASVTAHLSGTGFDFQASGSSSQTVASGQTANYSLSFTPSGNVPASFTFACGTTLPSYAACVFNPSSETVAGSSTGTATVQVTTGPSTSSSLAPPFFTGWRALPVAFGFLLVPFVWRRRKPLWTLVIFLGLTITISACSSSGGGSGGGSPTPVTHATPAGTYTIPVTLTSNGVQHSVSLTLVVD